MPLIPLVGKHGHLALLELMKQNTTTAAKPKKRETTVSAHIAHPERADEEF